MSTECDKLKGRMQLICKGSVPLPARVVNAYRQRWGLQPLQKQTKVSVSHEPCTGCGKKKQIVSKFVDRVKSLASSAVNFVADGMSMSTESQVNHRLSICEACPVYAEGWCDQNKGGCGCNLSLKVQARAAACPLGKWSAYRDDYRPLVNPTRHLVFHLYPLRGKEFNWHWHIEQIKKYRHHFERVVIGLATGPKTEPSANVKRMLMHDDIEWVDVKNTDKAETTTHVEMLSRLQTEDENTIILRAHTKGVTHAQNSVEQMWAKVLWETAMDLSSIQDALASHLTCGALRCHTPLVSSRPGDFFFAGSVYWVRAKELYERDWQHVELNRWWVEYVPAHLFHRSESACIFHDFTRGSIIRRQYFESEIVPEFDQWKVARCERSS